MNLDWSMWHKGHDRQVHVGPEGLAVSCMDCGVTANMEAISGKISPADSCKTDAKARKLLGAISEDVPFEGVIAR